MGKVIGYGKLGRSMPLTLAKCGNLGGDVEMVAVVKELALRHPDDWFVLLGRNSGELPSQVGLPDNVLNPWVQWGPELRQRLNSAGLNHANLSVGEHFIVQQIYDDITLNAFIDLDAFVMWVGQHGTSNTPLPRVDDPNDYTKPQDSFAYYAAYMLRGINHWRDEDPWDREEVNLNADARNVHKMRDLKWPLRHPVLGQFNSWKWIKHARYDTVCSPTGYGIAKWDHYASEVNDHTWRAKVHTAYSRLEVNGLRPGTPFGDLISYNDDWHSRPGAFGLFINEARAIGIRPELARRTILKDWVLPLDPHFIHGTWSTREPWMPEIKPAPWEDYYPKLHSVRCTLTTPSSGSGWATAKPWEAFAAGTVCFFHPAYDTQDNILGDAPEGLRDWLRVRSMQEMAFRIDHLNSRSGGGDWLWLVTEQRNHFDRALKELTYMKMIEERIYG